MKILLANKFYYPRGGDCLLGTSQGNHGKVQERERRPLPALFHELARIPCSWIFKKSYDINDKLTQKTLYISATGAMTTAIICIGGDAPCTARQ